MGNKVLPWDDIAKGMVAWGFKESLDISGAAVEERVGDK